tara:strand:+ start:437 stop:1627 length:1191 start_codon:yes stop_codon:yes gene_type:complete
MKTASIILFFILYFTNQIFAETLYSYTPYADSGGKIEIRSHNTETNTSTLLLTHYTGVNGGYQSGTAFIDEFKGIIYIPLASHGKMVTYNIATNSAITNDHAFTTSGTTYLQYGNSNTSGDAIIATGTDAEDNSSTTVLGSLDISDSNGNTLIEQDSTGTTIEIGEDSSGETGLIISNTSAALDIQDGSGNTMIKVTSDGATHIGENSLVTKEVNGRQELYATDATGNRIDINIPSGTNLLIDGEDVMGKIDSSVALGAAFASLPTGAEGAGYTCGLGTGFHDSASAISGGCGFDFANYSFVDSMPELFQKASFNIGAASVVHGEGDDATLKAGITFKFGAPKPVREARDNNLLLENKIDAVMAKNETIQTENDLMKAQIAEINTQLKALNMLAMN